MLIDLQLCTWWEIKCRYICRLTRQRKHCFSLMSCNEPAISHLTIWLYWIVFFFKLTLKRKALYLLSTMEITMSWHHFWCVYSTALTDITNYVTRCFWNSSIDRQICRPHNCQSQIGNHAAILAHVIRWILFYFFCHLFTMLWIVRVSAIINVTENWTEKWYFR